MTAKFKITVEAEPDISHEPELDRAWEEETHKRLRDGDVWAWCGVIVTVTCGDMSATRSLWGCSYQDEADFRENSGGYFEGMVSECKEELIAGARAVLAALAAEES